MKNKNLIKSKIRVSMNIMVRMFAEQGIRMKKICRTCYYCNECNVYCTDYSQYDVDDEYINTLVEEEVGNIDFLLFVIILMVAVEPKDLAKLCILCSSCDRECQKCIVENTIRHKPIRKEDEREKGQYDFAYFSKVARDKKMIVKLDSFFEDKRALKNNWCYKKIHELRNKYE